MLERVKKQASISAKQQIREMLLVEISNHAADWQLPTEQELCNLFQVSRMTVNQVIGQLVDEGLLYRIRSKGTFVKEKDAETKVIKMLLPGPGCLTLDNNHAKNIRLYLAGLMKEAYRLGLTVETVLTTPDHRLDSLDPDQFANYSAADNVFVVSQWWYPIMGMLAERGCRVVYVNSQIRMKTFDDYFKNWYLLTQDTFGMMEDAIDYFVSLGRKRILMFNAKDQFDQPDPRMMGYRSGLERHGIAVDRNLIVELSDWSSFDRNEIESLIRLAHQNAGLDAIIVPGINCLDTIYSVLQDLGLSVPEDVALLSLSDQEGYAELPIPLTAFYYPIDSLGIEAARVFARDSFVPGEKVFRPMLLERESTRKGAGARINPLLNRDLNMDESNNFFI